MKEKQDDSVINKILSEETESSNHSIATKIEKVKLFISNSYDDLPVLTSDMAKEGKVGPLLRVYFNDKELLIFKSYSRLESYLETNDFLQSIDKWFAQFLKSQGIEFPESKQSARKAEPEQSFHQNSDAIENSNENSQTKNQQILAEDQNNVVDEAEKHQSKGLSHQESVAKQNEFYPLNQPQTYQNTRVDFIAFIEFWLENQFELKVFYDAYRDVIRNSVSQFQEQVYRDVTDKVKRLKTPPPASPKRVTVQTTDTAIDVANDDTPNSPSERVYKSAKSNRQASQEEVADPFQFYMRKFYEHYCKKSVNTAKNQEFEKLAHYYSSMSLTKFMAYCKDLKLTQLSKKVTIKFLQKTFKDNENKDHILEFESFVSIINEILGFSFDTPSDIQEHGHRRIGVKDRKNFAEVMKTLGVIVPLNKVVFKKMEEKRAKSRMEKQRKKQEAILQKSRILKQSTVKSGYIKNGGYGHGYESSWDSNNLQKDLFMNEKERKQQRLLQNLSIPKLNKLQPSKIIDSKMHELIDDEYDPYLKRYNDKNHSGHENSFSGGHQQKGSGVIKRIDERINNVVKRMR